MHFYEYVTFKLKDVPPEQHVEAIQDNITFWYKEWLEGTPPPQKKYKFINKPQEENAT